MNDLELLADYLNIFVVLAFLIGISVSLYLLKLRWSASNLLIVLMNTGGFLLSLGDYIDDFYFWESADEFVSAFIIFFSSLLLILGIVVNLEEKLTYTEEKFKHLFENSPYSILLTNIDGQIINCNSSTYHLFGKKGKSFIRKNIKDLSIFTKEIRDSLDLIYNDKDFSKLEEGLVFKLENSERWFNFQILRHQYKTEIFFQAIIRDISEEKRLEQLEKQKIEKLKELDKIRSDLIRRVSHELKTPLNSIISTSDFLLKKQNGEINDNTKKFIKIISRGGARLNNLTKNLLEVFNLESKRIQLSKNNQDIVEIIKNCIDDFNILSEERNLQIKTNLDVKCQFSFDKIKIEQVISNLLSNAVKNTPPNGLIFVDFRDLKDSVQIIIKDTGIGFTENEKVQVFKKFGKIERKDLGLGIITEGSGLGLFISKEIVELHGGKINLESDGRNKGSTFTIILPKKITNSILYL